MIMMISFVAVSSPEMSSHATCLNSVMKYINDSIDNVPDVQNCATMESSELLVLPSDASKHAVV